MENQNNNPEENLPKEKTQQENIIPENEAKTTQILSTKKPFWEEFRTFFLDIVVVIIGVTLSTLLYDKITNYNQQKEVKKFLLGLKTDFLDDVKEMEEDKATYKRSTNFFNYLLSIKRNQAANDDSLRKHGYGFLTNMTNLVPNNGRYEGFKSAGKMVHIENDELQNDILNFYQQDTQALLASSNAYSDKKRKFVNYMQDNKVRETDSTNNTHKLLGTDKSYFLCKSLNDTEEIIYNYDVCINKVNKIISDINKQYK